jgi:hypothetical protein
MSEIFQTSDPDIAEQILRDAYGGNIRIFADGEPAGLQLASASLTPSVRLDDINFAMTFGLAANPLGVLAICHVRSGRVAYNNGAERTYGPGDVFFPVQPEQSYTAQCAQTTFESAVIDPAVLSQIADSEPARTQQPVRFTSYEPVSPHAAKIWNAPTRTPTIRCSPARKQPHQRLSSPAPPGSWPPPPWPSSRTMHSLTRP